MRARVPRLIRFFLLPVLLLSFLFFSATPTVRAGEDSVAIIEMDMMILPGTKGHLESAISRATADGAKILIVRLNTPGGILGTTQQMVQAIFESEIPIVIYVGPTGGTATSAGVFITLAGHIAAMAPGTSIGAAHPVAGGGEDIEGDMRLKAENMAVAMVKSIAEQRSRNVDWAGKAVKDSSSITADEALKMSVVDIVADDVDDLLKRIKGKKIQLTSGEIVLDDYSALPRTTYQMSIKDKSLNVLSNPTVAALLWLGATTGLSIELYNPGLIFPGVVGVLCLVLALMVNQVLPLNQGAVLLLVIGSAMIGAELYVPSGILGVAGVIAIVLGAMYLVDVTLAPGMAVSMEVILPFALICGGMMLVTAAVVARAMRRKKVTGKDGMEGQIGKAVSNISSSGRVFVNGEYWKAEAVEGVVEKGAEIEVVQMKSGLVLEVRPYKDSEL